MRHIGFNKQRLLFTLLISIDIVISRINAMVFLYNPNNEATTRSQPDFFSKLKC